MDERIDEIDKRLREIDKRLRVIEIWLLKFLEDQTTIRKNHKDIFERHRSEPTIINDHRYRDRDLNQISIKPSLNRESIIEYP
jgi:hypothetical protein